MKDILAGEKENWYALFLAIVSKEPMTVEEALTAMGISLINTARISLEEYEFMRKAGMSWKAIADKTGMKAPRSSYYHILKRKKNRDNNGPKQL